MTPPSDTGTGADTGAIIIPTGVPRTSAAHLVADGEPVTVVWSTIPVPCIDWLLGDITSQGPVHQPAHQPPTVWNANDRTLPIWHAITEIQCGVCGRMVGPWAEARDGHLVDDELTDLAREIAELADEERENQRNQLMASLAADAEDTVRHLAEGTLTRDELPDLGGMAEPGVGVHGDEVVAWAFMPHPDGPSAYGAPDPEIVEIRRPIPTDGPVS